MSSTLIHSTIPFSSYAHSHLEELNFGIQETPPSLEQAIPTRELNWFGRCVKHINEAQTPIARIGRGLLI